MADTLYVREEGTGREAWFSRKGAGGRRGELTPCRRLWGPPGSPFSIQSKAVVLAWGEFIYRVLHHAHWGGHQGGRKPAPKAETKWQEVVCRRVGKSRYWAVR